MYIQLKTILLLSALAYSWALTQYSNQPVELEDEHDDPPHYSFEYRVHDPHTGDIKSQQETRNDGNVKGFYMLQEADGTTREVHYTADKLSGFHAIVTKHGHPVLPAAEHY